MRAVMRKMSIYFAVIIFGMGLFAFVPTLSYAIPSTTASGTCDPDGTGRCTKTVILSASNSLLIIQMMNDATSQSIITADAFNLGVGVTAEVRQGTNLGNFVLESSPAGSFPPGAFNTAPFGNRQFVITATTNGPLQQHWQGGGNPSGPRQPRRPGRVPGRGCHHRVRR